MDHQKQIRDSLEKLNQLVNYIIFRFFRDPIQNIPYARSVKNLIKIIIFMKLLINFIISPGIVFVIGILNYLKIY